MLCFFLQLAFLFFTPQRSVLLIYYSIVQYKTITVHLLLNLQGVHDQLHGNASKITWAIFLGLFVYVFSFCISPKTTIWFVSKLFSYARPHIWTMHSKLSGHTLFGLSPYRLQMLSPDVLITTIRG